MFSRHSLKSNCDRQSRHCLKLNWKEWSHCHLYCRSLRAHAGGDIRRSPNHFIMPCHKRLSDTAIVLRVILRHETCQTEGLCRLCEYLCVIYSRADSERRHTWGVTTHSFSRCLRHTLFKSNEVIIYYYTLLCVLIHFR